MEVKLYQAARLQLSIYISKFLCLKHLIQKLLLLLLLFNQGCFPFPTTEASLFQAKALTITSDYIEPVLIMHQNQDNNFTFSGEAQDKG